MSDGRARRGSGRRAASGAAIAATIAALAILIMPAVGAVATPVPVPVPPAPPSPGIDQLTNVTETSATLFGHVGLSSIPVQYHVEYGTTTAYGSITPVPDAEQDPVDYCRSDVPPASPPPNAPPCWLADAAGDIVLVQLGSLIPGTTYHVRIAAHDSLGAATSADATFTTAGTAPTPTQPPSASPAQPVRPRPAILTRSAHVGRGGTVAVEVACRGRLGRCRGTLDVIVTRRTRTGRRHRSLVLAHASVTLAAGARKSVRLQLSATGLRLLAATPHHRLRAQARLGTARRDVVLAGAR